MPHKPGHGTQRRRIERQSRGQTAQPISRAAQKASRAALVDAESKRLQDFIDDNFNQANKQQASIQMIVEDMPEKFKKRFYDEFGNYIGPQNAADMVFVDFYDDGRNIYQRKLNRFLNESPETRAAYNRRFPITAALSGLPNLALGLVGGPALSIASNIISGGKQLGGMLKDEFGPTLSGLKSLFTDIDFGGKPKVDPLTREEAEAKTQTDTLATLNRQSDLAAKPEDVDIFNVPKIRDLAGPALSTTFTDTGFDPLFAFPRGMGARLEPGGIVGNYLVNDPGGFLRMANLPVSTTRGFAEGGIASLQDPNYNLLMEASDFSL
jgi:hypothetical protein